MEHYLRITKSTNDGELKRGDMFLLRELNGDRFYFISTENNSFEGTLEELKSTVTNDGGECEVYSFNDNTMMCFKCIEATGGSKFTAGAVYLCNIEKYNEELENPFVECIEGIELTPEDFEEECEYYETPRGLFVSIATSTKGHANFRVISFKDYLEKSLPKLEREFIAKKFDKYIPTKAELDKIKEKMIELFEEYEHDWTYDGIDEILRTWYTNKGELISAFMSHPNYNGNFQIVFSNETYVSETCKTAGRDFVDWIYTMFNTNNLLKPKKLFGKSMDEWTRMKHYLNATLPLVVPILDGDKMELLNYDLFEKRRREIEKVAFTIQLFNGRKHTEESEKERNECNEILNELYHYKSDRVSKEMAEFINKRLPMVRAREGQKTTKVVGKIAKHYGIDALEGYIKEFTRYCDAINVIRVTRHTVLSLNPIDYLTQSFGNSWASCHTIDKLNKRGTKGEHYEGQYCSGTLSYMLDNSSFVLYTVDSKYTGNTFYEMPKISRCMFHVENEKIVQGRCYPQAEDDNNDLYTQLRVLVQKTMADIWQIPNMWKIKRDSLGVYISSTGTNYEDYFHYSGCNVSVFKFTDNGTMYTQVCIGHSPICPVCGNEHDLTRYLACCSNICPECGERVHEFSEEFRYNDRCYHEDCMFWCEYHQQYEPKEKCFAEIDGYGNICADAYHYSSEFMFCDYCECYKRSSETEVRDDRDCSCVVCDDCVDRNFTYVESEEEYYPNSMVETCSECGADVLRDHIFESTDGEPLCHNCYERMETAEAV